MRLYVWEETGGYGAAATVVLANDLDQALEVVKEERRRLDHLQDAKTKAWQERVDRTRRHEYWLQTDEGKAWDAMPSGGFMALTDRPPARVIILGDVTADPCVVSNCWYYE